MSCQAQREGAWHPCEVLDTRGSTIWFTTSFRRTQWGFSQPYRFLSTDLSQEELEDSWGLGFAGSEMGKVSPASYLLPGGSLMVETFRCTLKAKMKGIDRMKGLW